MRAGHHGSFLFTLAQTGVPTKYEVGVGSVAEDDADVVVVGGLVSASASWTWTPDDRRARFVAGV